MPARPLRALWHWFHKRTHVSTCQRLFQYLQPYWAPAVLLLRAPVTDHVSRRADNAFDRDCEPSSVEIPARKVHARRNERGRPQSVNPRGPPWYEYERILWLR